MTTTENGVAADEGADSWSLCLVAVAADASREAFLSLYEHFGPRLKAYLMGMGTDEGQAEELVQETMLAVWRKSGQFQPDKATASTWIYRIARNLRVDRLRRDGRELTGQDVAEPAVRDASELLADSGPLREAIRQLPTLQAQTLYKSYFLGQTHSEIAAELEIPLGSVKSNLRLAFRALRRTLGVSS